MKKLHMTFLNEDGSKKKLVIHCVHQDLSPEAVKEAMQQIVELDLFEKDGVRLMTKVHSAKYVEIIETPLFDNINEMALPVPTPPVEENEPNSQEMKEVDASNQSEENPEVHGEEIVQQESTPRKQLAKIYPFIPREQWDLRKKSSHSERQKRYANQYVDSAELNMSLVTAAQDKPPPQRINERGWMHHGP